MKKYLILLLNLLSVSLLAQETQTPFTSKSFDGKSIQQLKVETSGGNITVTGGNTPARVEIYVRPANGKGKSLSKEDIQRKLSAEYDLDVSLSGNRLVATARPKNKVRDWSNALSISFVVFVPQNVSSDLTTSGGNIKMDGLTEGRQDLTTSGGNLSLNNVGGKIKGTTSGGNITVVHARESMELTTSGGNISAEACDGEMKLTTSGGEINLQQLNGNIKAITSGGNVKGHQCAGRT